MGNLIELPNISLESLSIERPSNASNKKSNFDVKNYLDTRLKKDEKKRKIYFRLLPMNLETGNPFELVHIHSVKVPKSMLNPGDNPEKPYKSYICLSKNKNIDHEKFGHTCPFCELNKRAYDESVKATDPTLKKDWQTISLDNKSHEAVICRGIERGKEADGVKFWKFNLRSDETDPYHQIMELVKLRQEEAAAEGKTENILDIYNGRDLIITITAEGTSAPTIADRGNRSPLSEDEEQMREWIYDKKKWQDVFTCKPYDFLKLVSESKHPWLDGKKGKWVDKAEYDAEHSFSGATYEKVDKANQAVQKMAMEASNNNASEQSKKEEAKQFMANITIDDDNMPF